MVSTTVVGNYPRIGDTPEEQRLRRAIGRFDEGAITQQEFKETERSVVRDVIAEQAAAGIALPTDGQITWYDSQSHFARHLEGVEVDGLVRYFDTNTYYRQPVVRREVRWREPATVDDWRFASSVAHGPMKAVVTGPYTLASLAKAGGSRRELVREFATAVAQEVRALRDAGATHIQIDEPAITRSPKDVDLLREGLDVAAGEKGDAWLCLFTFFGDVAGLLPKLARPPVDNLGLDLVQGARNLKALAKGGVEVPLTLGIVDARNTRRDDPEALAGSLLRLRGTVALEDAYISPSNGLEFLPRGKAREKLRLVAETAERVEARL